MNQELFLQTAISSAKKSGKILLNYFGKKTDIEFKQDNSPVTVADKESEENIIDTISKVFPDHSFLGEETGKTTKNSDYLWVIDPLDGTSNYSNKIPYFCISIALLYKEKPIVGVIYDPIHDDLFTASKDNGTYLNNEKIFISDDKFRKTSYVSLVYSRSKELKVDINKAFEMLDPPEFRIRNMGAAALELAYVAVNKLDGIIINGNNSWDVCAGILLIQEAGGVVTDFKNERWSLQAKNVVASSPEMHKTLINKLN